MIRVFTVGILSCAVTASVMPFLRRIARARGWLMARPAVDRWPHGDVVKIGGLAMLMGLTPVAFLTAGAALDRVLLLACLMFGAGLADDVRPIRPWLKLFAQVASTMLFLVLGPIPRISGIVWIDFAVALAWIV